MIVRIAICLLLVVACGASFAPKTSAADLPDSIELQADLVYAQRGDRALHLDLFRPAKLAAEVKLPAVVLVHGGGWINGDRTKFHRYAQTLAQRGFAVAAIEYRLAGEAKFPAAVQDTVESIVWLRKNADKFQIDPAKIAAVGGSAGGHLVALAAAGGAHEKFAPAGLSADDRARLTQLAACVVMAGPLDLARGTVADKSRKSDPPSNATIWTGKTILEAPELYELGSPRAHFTKETPPILVQVGELDHPENYLVPLATLREAGGTGTQMVYAEGKHGCWNNPRWMKPMIDDVCKFLATSMKLEEQATSRDFVEAAPIKIEHFSDRVELVLGDASQFAGKSIDVPMLGVPVGRIYTKGQDPEAKSDWKLQPEIDRWIITPPAGALPATGEARIVIETIDRTLVGDVPSVAMPDAERIVNLPAHRATVVGKKLRYEPQPHKNTVGYWTEVDDRASWKLFLPAGTYDVEVHQGCGKGHGGSEVDIAVGDQIVSMVVEDTGHFQNFKPRVIGRVTIEKPITTSLEIRPKKKAAAAVMDVRLIRLIPAT